ncbi:uncharacterized protein LOC120106132 [Phoenix dactylifera]|uniref:Uncharacterized protein LOC120106132 n=1 Tax=Phoenix dactylifera TaxID=42345 RepID=A0A8B8ZTV2_PHODC|nr:uncharacterized protein LOC120106132 [Phoenix dactylifera]
MESSGCMGLVAVFAISSSVVLVSLQVQKRLVSEFKKKVELELGSVRNQRKKKVRFAADVIEPSSNNEEYRRRRTSPRPAPAMKDFSLSL